MKEFNAKNLVSLLFVVGALYVVFGGGQDKTELGGQKYLPRVKNPTRKRPKRSPKRRVKKPTKKSKPQKKRSKKKVYKTKLVRVYRNLNTGTLSAQEKVNGGWRVTSHPKSVKLKNAKFIVNEAGRKKVVKTKQKNVHAYIQGNLVKGGKVKGGKVKYDPYKNKNFKMGRKNVFNASEVSVNSKGEIRAKV